MNIAERLRQAIHDGETLTVIYLGGSQPGTKRKISPLTIDDKYVRALDIATGEERTFAVGKIEVVGQETIGQDYIAGKPQQIFKDLSEALKGRTAELKALGWHIEIKNDSVSLHEYLKNGKVRKTETIQICKNSWDDGGETDSIESTTMKISMTEVTFETELSTSWNRGSRPWRVYGPERGGPFKDLDRAVALFLYQASKYAPNRKERIK